MLKRLCHLNPIFVYMRRRLLTIVLFLVSSTAYGQYYDDGGRVFSGGPVAGINFAQVDGDDCFGYYKTGANAGAMVYIRYAEKNAVSMEFLYVQKGAHCHQVTESPLYGQYISRYYLDLDYVQVPVSLHRILDWHKLDVEAGASFSYMLRYKEWVISDFPVRIDPVANRLNNIDAGVLLGIKANIYKKLCANFRFEYSVLSTRPAERIPVGYGHGSAGQFNNVINLRLLYLL